MDGLSAAASGIAVISLAIQLVDSIREIKRFLRSVSEAPKELTRLLDLLDHLELILENTGQLIQMQQKLGGELNVHLCVSVEKAMKTCETKLLKLDGVVKITKKASGADTRAARSFAAFRQGCKKRDIEEFEEQLHDSLSLLNLAISMSLV
ncbi:hypothetical protein G7Y89_g14014 [Cudoniella acicularis]|uniref:NACHT-NTPase and P-loop NTPases N-terminal domain-containing protein n=1 Tax=Cudoniella acicularis TaxID=354080 RepID=A0A8H4R9J3_9HELO|nr:hypothetical protein G7Y89_g14014 [Cudoniella acicularis]